MGRYCRICGRERANEKFSGKGHRDHVCKDCARLPKEEREAVEQEDEIFGYMEQRHISDKNVERLQILSASENERIAELAGIVLEVAKVKPYKKKRLQVLARERRDLLEALERTGLIYAHEGWPLGNQETDMGYAGWRVEGLDGLERSAAEIPLEDLDKRIDMIPAGKHKEEPW
ncbi:MAG: hypothetical protein V1792_21455 [Pseudomonadota bacterium]